MIAPVALAPAFTAAAPSAAPAPAPSVPAAPIRQSLIARPHTVLGVCEGIGEDLGFNPVILRIAFASGIFFAPMLVVGLYLGLGLVVAASRFAFPVRTAAPAREVAAEVETAEDYRIAAEPCDGRAQKRRLALRRRRTKTPPSLATAAHKNAA